MFDLTTYVKKWQIRQLKTVFSTLDTLCPPVMALFLSNLHPYLVLSNFLAALRYKV